MQLLYSINLFRHLGHIKMLRPLPRTALVTHLLLQTASRRPTFLALHSGNTITLHLSAIFTIQMHWNELRCVWMSCTYLHEWIHTAEFSLEALLATFAGNLLRVITATVEEVLEGSFRCHLGLVFCVCCYFIFQGGWNRCLVLLYTRWRWTRLRICGEMNKWWCKRDHELWIGSVIRACRPCDG